MNKIIVAIDGHSSTGKSTVAKQLAKELNYIFIDTGAMYRAVTWFALENGCINGTLDQQKLVSMLPLINIKLQNNAETNRVDIYVNNTKVTDEIRTLHVSKWVSPVAAVSAVRKKLVQQQQQMGKDKGVVMDGRDIGTVVFPKAALKLFMTASAEVRAKRRFKEMISNGEEVSFEEVLENVKRRDHIDSTRADSPLKKAEDAILIDNSAISRTEQFNLILQLALKEIQRIN